MKKISHCTQYEMSVAALIAKVTSAVAIARDRHRNALACLRVAYSFPVSTGFWVFRREFEAHEAVM